MIFHPLPRREPCPRLHPLRYGLCAAGLPWSPEPAGHCWRPSVCQRARRAGPLPLTQAPALHPPSGPGSHSLRDSTVAFPWDSGHPWHLPTLAGWWSRSQRGRGGWAFLPCSGPHPLPPAWRPRSPCTPLLPIPPESWRHLLHSHYVLDRRDLPLAAPTPPLWAGGSSGRPVCHAVPPRITEGCARGQTSCLASSRWTRFRLLLWT